MNKSNLKPIGIFIAIALLLTAAIVVGIRIVKNREAVMQQEQTTPVATAPNTHSSNESAPSSQPPNPSPNQGQQTAPSPTPTSSDIPQHVPNTGPSAFDFSLSALGMGLGVYFMLRLRQSKLAYRRLLNNR